MEAVNVQAYDIKAENGNLMFKINLPAGTPIPQRFQLQFSPPVAVEKPAEDKEDSDDDENELIEIKGKIDDLDSFTKDLDTGIEELVSRVDKLEELVKKLTETATSTEQKLTYHLREEQLDYAIKILKEKGHKYFFKNEVNDLEKKILTDMGYTIAYTTKDILPHHLAAAIEEENYEGKKFLRDEHENVIIYKDPNRKGRGFFYDMNKMILEWADKERKKTHQDAKN